jgi:predicted nucleotidyltransferase
MDSIRQILQRLSDHGVDFVVIGGVAAALHGSVRVTLDVDVCAALSEPNLSRILAALRGLHPKWRMRPDKPALPDDPERLRNFRALYLDTDIGILDVLTEVTGVGGFDEVLGHSLWVDAGGFHVRVIDLDSLIAAKRATGRPKDREPLVELENIRRELLNRQRPEPPATSS